MFLFYKKYEVACGDQKKIFDLISSFLFKNIKMLGGKGGAMYMHDATATIENCYFFNNIG